MFAWKKTMRSKRRRSLAPPLRFSPTAWAKLLYLRDLGETEVGGFAISHATALLSIEDVQLLRQICSPTSVAFDDPSVADFFDSQVDLGRPPQEFGRIWVHTHPGDCPRPSPTDEETFARVFGNTDWAVMFILAQGGQTYARLQINAGPGVVCLLPVEIDYRPPFGGSDEVAWKQEYAENVTSWHEALRADRLAQELAAEERLLQDSPLLPERPRTRLAIYDQRDEPFEDWRDPFFYGGDDPPFDFELQRMIHEGF